MRWLAKQTNLLARLFVDAQLDFAVGTLSQLADKIKPAIKQENLPNKPLLWKPNSTPPRRSTFVVVSYGDCACGLRPSVRFRPWCCWRRAVVGCLRWRPCWLSNWCRTGQFAHPNIKATKQGSRFVTALPIPHESITKRNQSTSTLSDVIHTIESSLCQMAYSTKAGQRSNFRLDQDGHCFGMKTIFRRNKKSGDQKVFSLLGNSPPAGLEPPSLLLLLPDCSSDRPSERGWMEDGRPVTHGATWHAKTNGTSAVATIIKRKSGRREINARKKQDKRIGPVGGFVDGSLEQKLVLLCHTRNKHQKKADKPDENVHSCR